MSPMPPAKKMVFKEIRQISSTSCVEHVHLKQRARERVQQVGQQLLSLPIDSRSSSSSRFEQHLEQNATHLHENRLPQPDMHDEQHSRSFDINPRAAVVDEQATRREGAGKDEVFDL